VYVTTITLSTTTTFTEAKDIKVKFSGNTQLDVKLNQDALFGFRLPKGCLSNFSGTAYCTKLKLSGQLERDIELTKRHFVLILLLLL